MSKCQGPRTAARPIPEGMTIFCLPTSSTSQITTWLYLCDWGQYGRPYLAFSWASCSQLHPATRTTDDRTLLQIIAYPHWWSKWDNNRMYLTLPKMTWPSHQIQIQITTYRSPIPHNCWNVKPIWLPILLHRMQTIQCYREKRLFTCENESCELTDHSATFRSSIIQNLRSRNFFGHNNTLSLRREERYKFAIHKFPHSTKLSSILCQRLM